MSALSERALIMFLLTVDDAVAMHEGGKDTPIDGDYLMRNMGVFDPERRMRRAVVHVRKRMGVPVQRRTAIVMRIQGS